MSQLLRIGETVHAQAWDRPCVVEDHLGGGGQGEVYRVSADGQPFALKWYAEGYLGRAPRLRDRLERAIREGPPSDRFLWPLDLTFAELHPEFGYLMKLREKRFRGLNEWLNRDVNPSFAALATTGFELADNMLLLHAQKGLCYRDINYNNVFFDPATGEIRICDNDNVDVNLQPGEIGGTPKFMAPEIVRGEALPTIDTDRYSLAVLLFLLFMVHHPLDGALERAVRCLDVPAMRKLYGTEPVFIFDPADDSNRPVPGPDGQQNPLAYWPIYPKFLRDLFTRAFTDGLRDPKNGRVMESEWCAAMARLRDSLMHCPRCRAENFYDADALKAAGGRPPSCWNCRTDFRLPYRIRLGQNVVILGPRARLFPHHVDPLRKVEFTAPVAEVTPHPAEPEVLGLTNLAEARWIVTGPDHAIQEVGRGQTCRLVHGATIQFGPSAGEVRQ
jgi:DNA-binding helix-hairpin-helix protein with protein kinase domain